MIKVPATPEGLPAIEHLIGEGISVNITLLFSQEVYLQVAEAYLAGPGKICRQGRRSLACRERRELLRQPHRQRRSTSSSTRRSRRPTIPSEKERLAALKGKVAIANAKLAYQDYKRLFAGARWEKLAAKGAKPQRLLWASTGTKNKDYRDVLYVEELIGPNTVNTVPPATLDAFRDHGKLRDSLEENIEDARARARRAAEVRHLARCDHGRAGQGRRQAVRRRRRQALRRGRAQARHRARRRHRPPEARARRRHRARRSRRHTEEWRAHGQDPPAVEQGQVGLDRQRRGQMAGLADQPRGGRHRRLRGFRRSA